MNAKNIFLTTLGGLMVCLLAIGLIFGNSSTVSADAIKDKVENETYLDYIRSTATTEVVGDFTKYFLPDTKTVEIYDDKSKPMLNMTWLTDYEERVGIGEETEVACARIDYIDDKVLPVFNQIKSYDKKNNYEEINKDFSMKIRRPIISESCYNEAINNETNESQEVCYEYDATELIPIGSLIDVKYFSQEVCWYTETIEGDNIEFVIGNGDFWLVEFASFLVEDVTNAYHLDESSGDAIDAAGSNDGTVTTAIQGVPGKLGTAYSFNDDSDKVVADSGITGDTTATIMAWVKTVKTTGDQKAIVANSHDTLDHGWGFGVYQDNLRIILPGVAWSSGSYQGNDGNWHSVMLTRDGSTYNLYADGGSSVISTLTNGGGTFSDKLLLSGHGSGSFWDGEIDEVVVFSSVKSTDDFADFDNLGVGIPYPFSVTCTFSGFVLDEQGGAIVGANVTITNQHDQSEFYENTTIAGGEWSLSITNSTKTFEGSAQINNTIVGFRKGFISGTC